MHINADHSRTCHLSQAGRTCHISPCTEHTEKKSGKHGGRMKSHERRNTWQAMVNVRVRGWARPTVYPVSRRLEATNCSFSGGEQHRSVFR